MSTDKITVTFTADVDVHDHNGETVFKAASGDVVKLPYHSAQRWIRRGKAIEGGQVKQAPAKKATKKKAVKS